jgi:hypothetical protein
MNEWMNKWRNECMNEWINEILESGKTYVYIPTWIGRMRV